MAALVAAVAFMLLQWGIGESKSLFLGLAWPTNAIILCVVLLMFGAALVFVFQGEFRTRMFYIALVPAATQLVMELTWSHDPAYPWLTALFAVPFTILFVIGAVLIGRPILLRQQASQKSHLTANSSGTR